MNINLKYEPICVLFYQHDLTRSGLKVAAPRNDCYVLKNKNKKLLVMFKSDAGCCLLFLSLALKK